jgi:hypothetical protein
MKTCSYCGKQYPDDATVCAADGETLPGSVADRKKVTGCWRGVYGYGQREKQPGLGPVAFTLKLKQGWLAHFEGSVTEDAQRGNPDAGTVDGYFNSPVIEFTKQMPVGYVIGADGGRRTLREHLLAEGHQCEHDLPAAPVFYQGTLLGANRMQGIWTIRAQRIPLARGESFAIPPAAGFWCAEFVSTDVQAGSTGGPTTPLFDKTLLSLRELEAVEGVPFGSLGKFNVADAGKLLERFGQANIRFETRRVDDATNQTTPIMEMTGGYAGTTEMIEIVVHPEDVEEAKAILLQDDQV